MDLQARADQSSRVLKLKDLVLLLVQIYQVREQAGWLPTLILYFLRWKPSLKCLVSIAILRWQWITWLTLDFVHEHLFSVLHFFKHSNHVKRRIRVVINGGLAILICLFDNRWTGAFVTLQRLFLYRGGFAYEWWYCINWALARADCRV